MSSEQKRVLFEESEQGGGRGPNGIVAPGNGDYSSKARAARVFVCPPQPARAWPQAPSPRSPPSLPCPTRAELGIVCGEGLLRAQWGEGVTKAGFLEEGSLEEENGLGLRGEKNGVPLW